MITKPTSGEYDEAFARYVSLVTDADILGLLTTQIQEMQTLAKGVNGDQEHFRYAQGKWSVREVFGHLVDSERVFGYRAFCISRGERANLPSFDENQYVAESFHDRQSVMSLVDDFAGVRRSNVEVFSRLSDERWERMGKANGRPISVRALAYIMAGHVRHHYGVLRANYGLWP